MVNGTRIETQQIVKIIMTKVAGLIESGHLEQRHKV